MITIRLKVKKEQSLLRFHPWVFSGAIDKIEGKPKEGSLVEVRSHEGKFLGVGHYQVGSIAVRILSFLPEKIDDQFWLNRIEQAGKVRERMGLRTENNNAFRLVHGEGDGLPGLIVDVYAHTAVLQAHSVGMHLAREAIAEAIIRTIPAVESVYYKSSTTLPFRADVEKEEYYIRGGASSDFTAIENRLRFRIDWLEGQKTGFFIDQRENRSLLEKYASGSSVLNMFCYTGGFSVYALSGGAQFVHSVDSSEKAIELTNRNVALNFPEATNHTAYAEDAYRFFEKNQQVYDLIILDPPAFAKHRDAVRNALRGYRRINAEAIKRVSKGGVIFTFSCSQVISKEQFRLAVFSAAAEAKREVRILQQLSQPADHPINIYHPEGEYLKGLILYVE